MFFLSCRKKAVEVSALLLPAISMASRTLPSLQANSRVVAGLLSPPRTGRVHQRRLSLEYPFPPQIGIGPKVGFVYEEDFGPTLLGLLSDLAVLEDEGFPRFILGFQGRFLGRFSTKPNRWGGSSSNCFDSAPGQSSA